LQRDGTFSLTHVLEKGEEGVEDRGFERGSIEERFLRCASRRIHRKWMRRKGVGSLRSEWQVVGLARSVLGGMVGSMVGEVGKNAGGTPALPAR